MSVSPARDVPSEGDPEPVPAPDGAPSEVAALLGVLATLFLDNVRELENTVARVTALVMRDNKPDRELIVTLQSFDRLKQEFEALSFALARYAESTNALLPIANEGARGPFGRDVIEDIALSDLRQRFLGRLENGLGTVYQPLNEPSADELEVDVEF
jgi:transcriptional regulator with AAA-type ATPase domain